MEVERHSKHIGLGLNAKKTKVMAENVDQPVITTLDGTKLDVVKDFQYLGVWITSTQNDIEIRRARSWRALHGMKKVWHSYMEET